MSKPIEASIVVVDDEPSIRELLVASLHFAGFEVNTAASGSEAIEVIERLQPDLIVLDVMLPDIDGFTVTRRIRQEGITTPVLYLTARDDTQDKVMGLTVGGDDYVTKPFSLEEVVARIRAILRRTQQQVEDDPIIRVGDLEINEDSHDVSRAGQPASALTATEYKLLRYLMDNEGRVLSKAQILDHVWQYDWGGDAAIVESYISYLRKKVDGIVIEDENGDKHKVTPLIETKRGIGYMIRAPKELDSAMSKNPNSPSTGHASNPFGHSGPDAASPVAAEAEQGMEPFQPQDSSDSAEHETGHLHHRAADHRHHRHLLFHTYVGGQLSAAEDRYAADQPSPADFQQHGLAQQRHRR